MASNNQLELALRVKVLVEQAKQQLRELGQAVHNVGGSGQGATKQVDKLDTVIDAAGKSSKTTTGKVDKLDQAVNELTDGAKKATSEIKRTTGALDKVDSSTRKVHTPLKNASKDMRLVGLSAGQQSMAMRQLPMQITDIVTGLVSGQPAYMVAIQQGGQLRDVFGGMGNAMRGIGSVAKKTFTPMRLAVGGAALAVGTLTVALVKGYLEAQHLNQVLEATGHFAQRSGAQLVDLANAVGESRKDFSGAREAVMLLVGSGKIAGDELDQAAAAAVDFSQVTGRSIEDSVAAILSLRNAPVDAVYKLDQQYHFLTATVYDNIIALQNEGRAADATALAQSALAAEMDRRRQTVSANLGAIQRAWRGVKNEVSQLWTILKNLGATSITSQIEMLEAARASKVRHNLMGAVPFIGAQLVSDDIGSLTLRIAHLREKLAQQQAANGTWASHGDKNPAAIAALHEIKQLESASLDSNKVYLRKVDQINDAFNAAIEAMPKKAAELNARRDTLLQDLTNDYVKGVKSRLDAKSARDQNQQRQTEQAAATVTRDVAVANQQLRTSFTQLQSAADPTAAAMNRYTQTMDRAQAAEATAAANLDKLVAGHKMSAQAALAQKQVNAGVVAGIERLAAASRDAALDKIADKDRKAWERLRDSLRTPVQVALDQATAKLKELKRLMDAANSGMTAEQFSAASAQIGRQSVQSAPQYQGLDASVGGIGSELARNYQAQQALDAWHAQALASTEKYHAQGKLNEEAYQAALTQIQGDYTKQRNKIDQSRGALMLQTASGVFGQLAQLSSSHNSKMARIGKAAAIAQAIINTYQSATGAYNALSSIYMVGPYLGAAAAAAAIAAGLANVQRIRAQPVGGYATGGYTGRGGKYEVAGVVHRGEGVLSQEDVAVMGGPDGFARFQRSLRGYAQGGYVSGPADFADVPAPNVSMPAMPSMPAQAMQPAAGGSGGGSFKVVVVMDKNQVADEILNSDAGQKVIVRTAGENPGAIKGRWGS